MQNFCTEMFNGIINLLELVQATVFLHQMGTLVKPMVFVMFFVMMILMDFLNHYIVQHQYQFHRQGIDQQTMDLEIKRNALIVMFAYFYNYKFLLWSFDTGIMFSSDKYE